LDIQSYIALGIVAITAAAFAYRIGRSWRKTSCEKGCCCGKAEKNESVQDNGRRWIRLVF
jgi:hypothetical protein